MAAAVAAAVPATVLFTIMARQLHDARTRGFAACGRCVDLLLNTHSPATMKMTTG